MSLPDLLARGALADEFARLRHDIAADPRAPRHVVVLGAAGGEGTTTVATHLALALAGVTGNGEVLLVEANLRAPSLERDLALPTGPGLRQWDLQSPLPLRRVAALPGLQVVTAGAAEPMGVGAIPIEERLSAALARARQDFTHSVWDSPPVLHYSDGLDLAAQSDGALVVIEMDQTRVGGLRYVRDALARRHAVLLGSMLNRAGRYWPRAAATR